MDKDAISLVEIDAVGQLHIVPASRSFPLIYREGMEVNWHGERRSLHSPRPREWSYSRWFRQILSSAREQGVSLYLSEDTKWRNIEPSVKAELLQAAE
jgi:hypothetical protein